MKYTLFLVFILFNFIVNAHNPSAITYDYDLNKNTLTIHLTPKTAIDLIRDIKPELEQHSIIKLSEYYYDFTNYFNRTINLTIENTRITYEFTAAELQNHDATIVFNLKNRPQNYSKIELTLDSFVSIYKRIDNYVVIKNNNQIVECHLDKENRYCNSDEFKSIKKFKSLYYKLLFFIVIILGVFLILKRKYK